ncbi:acetate kinase, partial [Candidatus Woesearchaeota archaeon]|nr:acetate kinase [Candidatus Woesearchaeota archaeon]
ILRDLEFLGVKFNPASNRRNHILISSASSKVKVYVIPTNEELEIARETKELLG